VPGVYLFADISGQILYVGKAINLKNRVRSYFAPNNNPKVKLLVPQIAKIDYLKVETDFEALLLEAALIKKYQPKYNAAAKDDRNPLYIKITRAEIPLVLTCRKEEEKGAYYFGPYPSARTTRFVLKSLRKIFPYRSTPRHPKRSCFYCHLSLCPGPNLGGQSLKNYQKTIVQLIKLLAGQKVQLIKELEREMQTEARRKNFEEAAELRDKISGIEYITSPRRRVGEYLKNPHLFEDERNNELMSLAQVLGFPVQSIEAYDVSNISGKLATGSLVTFVDGKADKSRYRRFRIRFKDTPDDLAMISEVLKRRLGHSEWPLPDLILIDGGKTQVEVAMKVLKKRNIEIPAIGLAKRPDRVISVKTIAAEKDSPAMKLLVRIRDEAHRFALAYHRHLRQKALFSSGFKCLYCRKWVPVTNLMGTAHRNHCPFCLWSRHVDQTRAGDRKSKCQEGMAPVGLTFKQEGKDKYQDKTRQGELMLIHQCRNPNCGKISLNRIAADDEPAAILAVFEKSQTLPPNPLKMQRDSQIKLLTRQDEKEVRRQLFGNY